MQISKRLRRVPLEANLNRNMLRIHRAVRYKERRILLERDRLQITNTPEQDGNQTDRVFLQIRDHIAEVVLNRPEKRNALNVEMWTKIKRALEECERTPEVKVVVIRSSDPAAFCAGADIAEFPTLRSGASSREYSKMTDAVIGVLQSSDKPSIAMLDGFCVGGGAEIAVACDFRFASGSLKMGITPAKLGIVYGFTETKMLVDLVGPSRAKDILFSGRLLGAEEALQIGLVDRVFASSEELQTQTLEYASMLTSNAPNSIRATKRMVQASLRGLSSQVPELVQLVEESFESPQYKEGVQAFLEKRKPQFPPL